jgi:hypothetical protein
LLFAVLALPVAAVAIALVLTAALLAFLLFLIATRELLPLSGLLLAALSLPLTLLLTLSSPPAARGVGRYDVRVEGEDVKIEIA